MANNTSSALVPDKRLQPKLLRRVQVLKCLKSVEIMTLISGFMLRWGGYRCLGYVWMQTTWYQREILHPHVQSEATMMKLLPTERKNNLIKNAPGLKYHEQRHRDSPRTGRVQ